MTYNSWAYISTPAELSYSIYILSSFTSAVTARDAHYFDQSSSTPYFHISPCRFIILQDFLFAKSRQHTICCHFIFSRSWARFADISSPLRHMRYAMQFSHARRRRAACEIFACLYGHAAACRYAQIDDDERNFIERHDTPPSK